MRKHWDDEVSLDADNQVETAVDTVVHTASSVTLRLGVPANGVAGSAALVAGSAASRRMPDSRGGNDAAAEDDIDKFFKQIDVAIEPAAPRGADRYTFEQKRRHLLSTVTRTSKCLLLEADKRRWSRLDAGKNPLQKFANYNSDEYTGVRSDAAASTDNYRDCGVRHIDESLSDSNTVKNTF